MLFGGRATPWGGGRGSVVDSRDEVGQGMVRPLLMVRVFASAERLLDWRQVQVTLVAFPDPGPTRAIGVLDTAVEFGGAWGQDQDGNAACLTHLLNAGPTLALAHTPTTAQREMTSTG